MKRKDYIKTFSQNRYILNDVIILLNMNDVKRKLGCLSPWPLKWEIRQNHKGLKHEKAKLEASKNLVSNYFLLCLLAKFGFTCSLWVTGGNRKGKYEYIAWTNIQNLFGAWEKQRKGLNNEKDHLTERVTCVQSETPKLSDVRLLTYSNRLNKAKALVMKEPKDIWCKDLLTLC